jgi:uncharacterized membrane protein
MWRLVEPRFRVMVSLLAAALTFLSMSSFAHMGTRIVVAWNVGVMVLLGLIATMMWRSDPKETLRRAQKDEPSNVVILLVTIVTAVAGLVAISYALAKTDGMSRYLLVFHTCLSIVGVFFAWLLIHTLYSLHYAKIYYDETEDGEEGAFKKGLAFPGGTDIVDYWDFVYYSFTIAMCYQTSDVAVTSPAMRRLTIFHAIVSFLFVLVILGLLVNIISNVV